MNLEATTERELTETSEGKALLLDSFGLSKEFARKGQYAWVRLGRADTDAQTMAAQGFETDQLQPALTGPIFGYLTWGATDTGDATARALDLGEPEKERYQVALEDLGEASTAPICSKGEGLWPRNEEQLKRVEDRIDSVFRMALGEDFEDGMSSRFSRELLEAVGEFGDPAMQEISYLILYNRTNQEVASETLRWLGRVSDIRTYGWRLWLLEKSLLSSSPVVRDGAVLGLASLGDPSAVTYLREAIAVEECKELREDMQQALRELEAAGSAAIAQKDQEE